MKRWFFLFTVLACYSIATAQVRLPNVFGDSMVLQRDHTIPIWGWAGSNEKIMVQFHQQTKTTKAGKDGQWKILLDNEAAGGPYTLTVKGKNTITLNGILLGDVWVCSGQSNMEFNVNGVTNAAAEIASANYPEIRHFYLPKAVSSTPLADVQTSKWQSANPASVGDFTAVGYFFARELNQQLHIPIGLIHTSWGGTDVETWISNEGLKNSEPFGTMMAGLPALNLDSIAATKQKKLSGFLEKVQGGLPNASQVNTFKEASFDDKGWPSMQLPQLWEQQQLPDLDGTVWLRKTITLSEADAGKPAVLKLAMIDDADETYVNGTKVGSTNGYNVKRVYNIPAGVLHAGTNVIAVRADDTGGGGGIYGDAGDLNITIGNSAQPLAGDWQFQVASVASNAVSVGPNSYPSLLYNAMIHPIIPFAIKGATWYQGENNAGRAYQYRKAFPLLITDWRKQWKQGDFPFYFVQLASFNAGNGNSKNGSNWAELREAQAMTLSLPNTGMAVTTDVGEANDIHPKNKQDVGKRLAALALHNTYGKDMVYEGPVYKSMQVNGDKVTLAFSQTGSGLMVKDKYGYLKGFEIAGEDQQFHYAKAFVEGDHVVVYADEVSKPTAVRYGWADDAGDDNLYNKEGFPAAPFRTDQWKGITENNEYKVSL